MADQNKFNFYIISINYPITYKKYHLFRLHKWLVVPIAILNISNDY